MGLIACVEGDLKPEGNSAVAVLNVTDPGVGLKPLSFMTLAMYSTCTMLFVFQKKKNDYSIYLNELL